MNLPFTPIRSFAFALAMLLTLVAGTVVRAQAPTISAISANAPGTALNAYNGNVITVTGTNLNTVTAARVGGSGGAIAGFTLVSATSLTVTVPAGASGTVWVSNPSGNVASASSLINQGYITTATGDWSTAGTWLGNAVPPNATSTNVTIAHNVTGTPTTAVGRLTVNSGVTLTITSSTTVTVNAASTNTGTVAVNGTLATAVTYTNSGTLNCGASGTIQINQGGYYAGNNFVYAAGGTLLFNNTSGSYGIASSHVYWPATNQPTTLTVQGSGGITIGSGTTRSLTNLNLNAGCSIGAANMITVTGTLRINSGGSISTNAPVYGASSTLQYATGGAYTISTEWTGNTITPGSGAPFNVTVSSSNLTINAIRSLGGTLSITGGSVALTSTALTMAGNLDIQAGGLTINSGSAANVNVAGNVSRSGSSTLSNTGAGSGTIVLYGTAQTLSNTSSGAASGVNYTVSNGTVVTLATDFALNTTGASTFTVNSGSTLAFGTNVLSGTGTSSFVNNGNLRIGSTAGIEASAASGNVQTNSRSFSATGNYTYNGSAPQSTGTGLPASLTTPSVLTISNNAGVTLSQTTSAFGLTFTSGLLTLGSSDLTVTGTLSGAGTSTYIQTSGSGQLRRTVGSSAVAFPIGNSAYNPATLTNTGTSDVYGVRVIDAAPPAVADATKAVNRYWVVTEANGGGSTLAFAGQYNSSELGTNYAAGTTPYLGLYAGSLWTQSPATLSGSGPFTGTGTNTFSPSSLPATSYFAIFKDQVLTVTGTTYTWVGGTSTDWATSANWSPNTGFPGSADTAVVSTATPNPVALNGNRTVSCLTLNGTGALTAGSGESLTINNVFTYGGSATASFASSSTFTLAGSASQPVPAFSYGNLSIAGGPRVLASSGTIEIAGSFTPGAGTITTTGSTVRFTTTAAGTVVIPFFTSTTANRSFNHLELVGGASTVFNLPNSYSNGLTGDLRLTGAGTLNIVNSGNSTVQTMNVGGDLTLSGSGTINIGAGPFAGTINVAGGTNISAGLLQVTNTATGSLTNRLNTNTLTISGTGRLNLEASSSSSNSIVAVTSALNVTSTTAYALDLGSGTANGSGIADGNSVTLGGNLSKSGTGTIGLSGTYSAFAGLLFSGAGTQTLSYSGAAVAGGNIGVNAGSTLQLNSNLPFSASGITGFAAIGRLNAGAYSVIAGNTSSGFSTNGTGSVISTSLPGGLSEVASGFNVLATAWPAGTTFEYTGTSPSTGFAAYASALSNAYGITWLGSGNLTLDAPLTVSSLALTNSGLFILGSNNLTVTNTGTITGSPFSSSKMIVADGTGSLLRSFSAGGTGIPFTFPIGDNSSGADYSPVTIGSLSATAGGTLGFRVVDAAEPNNGTAVNYLTRHWPYTVTGGGTYSWGSATFGYVTGDIVGTETLLKADAYNTTNGWTEFASSSASSNLLTLTSGPSNTSLASGDNLTGRLTPVIADYYRSTGSGAWTTLSTWEVSTDPTFTSPAPVTATSIPAANNSLGILIQAGHTVTFASGTLTVDQLTVAAGAILTASGGTFNLAATSPALTLNGTFNLGATSTWASGGTVSIGSSGYLLATVAPSSSATVSVAGSYEYGSTSGAIPTATWSTGSLLTISGVTSAAPTGLGQAFYDLVWNCPNQSAAVNLSGGLSTAGGASIGRDFTLTSSNGQEVRLASTTSASLVIGRDLNISSGVTLTMLASTSSFTAPASTLAIGRDLTIGGSGTFQQTGANATGTNTITTTVAGNVNMSTTSGVRLALSGTPTGVMSVAGNFSHSGSGTVRIGTGSGNQTLNVTGAFTMSGTAVLDFTSGSGSVTFNAYGDFAMPSLTTVSRSGGGTPTLNFLKSTGTQTWTTGGSLTTNALGINIGNNSIANTVVLTNNLALLGGYINIQGGSTLDMGPNVISGPGSISQYFQAGLKIGHPQGIVASGTAAGNIQTTSGRNYNNGGYFTYTGTTNQVTGTGLPNSLQNALTIANTGTLGNNTVTLTTTPTQMNTLVLQSGVFAIGSGATVNVSNNGTVSGTGGDFATGATGGTLNFFGTGTLSGTLNPYVVSTSGQLDFGAGTVTIQSGGRYILNSGGATLINRGPYYASGATLQYNSGGSYNRSNEWVAGTGRGAPHHVIVTNNTSLKPGGNASQLLTSTIFQSAGDLTINSGSAIDMSAATQVMTLPLKVSGNLTLGGTLTLSTTLGGDLEVLGNMVNNGTLTPNDRAVTFSGSTDATLSGSSNTTFAYLTINKAAGRSLTPTVPFTLSRSGGGLFRVQGGIWNLNGQTMTLGSGTNTLQIDAGTSAGQTLKTGGTTITGFSAYYNGTVLDSLGGKVDFSGPAAETIPSGIKGFTRLSLSGAGSKSLSQSLRVNDSLNIASGTTLDLGASAAVVTARGTVINQGTVAGSSTGKVFLGGFTSQNMVGSGTYRNLEIGNASDVYSSGDPIVSNSLILSAGKIYTGADTLILGSSATITETIGASQNFVRGNLRTVRTVGTAAQSFGGMGVSLSAGADLGTVFVNRQSGTAVAGSGVCCTANHSIQRIWTITPSIEPATPTRNLTLSWPSQDDNGQNMLLVQPWKSPDGLQAFSRIGNVQNVSGGNPRSVVINNVPSFSVWTVADDFNPLPLGLVSFTGQNRKGIGQLAWEVNGDKAWVGFTVEKSIDGKRFAPLAYVEVGTDQARTRFGYADRNLNRDSYYRLRLKAQDGSTDLSETIRIRLDEERGRSLTLFPNPALAGAQWALDGQVESDEWVQVELATLEGKQLLHVQGRLTDINRDLDRSVAALASGLYQVRISTQYETFTQKLLKP